MDKDIKTAFKVCRLYHGKLFSLVMITSRNGALCKQYIPNKWTVASKTSLRWGYGLTCFMDWKTAYDFARKARKGAGQMQIWECEIGDMILASPKGVCLTDIRMKNLPLIKTGILRYTALFGENIVWPFGTIMVDKIKLVKFVQNVDPAYFKD